MDYLELSDFLTTIKRPVIQDGLTDSNFFHISDSLVTLYTANKLRLVICGVISSNKCLVAGCHPAALLSLRLFADKRTHINLNGAKIGKNRLGQRPRPNLARLRV